jgi:hypothetical protein
MLCSALLAALRTVWAPSSVTSALRASPHPVRPGLPALVGWQCSHALLIRLQPGSCKARLLWWLSITARSACIADLPEAARRACSGGLAMQHALMGVLHSAAAGLLHSM